MIGSAAKYAKRNPEFEQQRNKDAKEPSRLGDRSTLRSGATEDGRSGGGCNPFRVGGFCFRLTQGSPEGFRGNPGLDDSIPLGLQSGAALTLFLLFAFQISALPKGAVAQPIGICPGRHILWPARDGFLKGSGAW